MIGRERQANFAAYPSQSSRSQNSRTGAYVGGSGASYRLNPGFQRLMKLLIDECVDERLRLLFPGHECQTARLATLAGLKNGRLLEAAEAAGFDVLITVDQNIPDQQNLSQRKIAIVILCGRTNRLRDLELLVPAAISALGSVRAGDVVKVR